MATDEESILVAGSGIGVDLKLGIGIDLKPRRHNYKTLRPVTYKYLQILE